MSVGNGGPHTPNRLEHLVGIPTYLHQTPTDRAMFMFICLTTNNFTTPVDNVINVDIVVFIVFIEFIYRQALILHFVEWMVCESDCLLAEEQDLRVRAVSIQFCVRVV